MTKIRNVINRRVTGHANINSTGDRHHHPQNHRNKLTVWVHAHNVLLSISHCAFANCVLETTLTYLLSSCLFYMDPVAHFAVGHVIYTGETFPGSDYRFRI